MSEPIPAAELAAFRELLDEATDGPWVVEATSFDITTVPDARGYRHVVVVGSYDDHFDDESFTIDTPETREFIAQSREMCGRLLDEVDRLRCENERLKAAMQQVIDGLSIRGDWDWAKRVTTDILVAALAAKGGE